MAYAATQAACPEPVTHSDGSGPAAACPAAPLPGLSSSAPVSGWLRVDAMDLEAQGVARRADGKVVFIDGALPTEWVSAQTRRSKNQWEQADLSAIHRESALRVQPRCPHFGLHAGACGGCKMQHLDAAAQVAVKQRVLEDNLWHLAKVRPETPVSYTHLTLPTKRIV